MCAAPAPAIDPGKGLFTRIFHCGDGYSYHANREIKDNPLCRTVFLRCAKYTDHAAHCSGRAILYERPDGQEWKNTKAHMCRRDRFASQTRLLRHDILDACRNRDYVAPRTLVNEHAERYPFDVAARIRQCTIRHSMKRARYHLFPRSPADLNGLQEILEDPANDHIAATKDKTDQLYLGTVGPEGERCTIYVSRRIRRFMKKIHEVFSDATFTPTPVRPKGRQVWQIVCLRRKNVIPLVVVHMEAKTYEAYRAVLLHLQEHIPRFRPRVVVADFEPAQQMAWREVYHCIVRGCYIHYVRNVGRKGKKYGITKRLLRNEPELRSIFRSFMAIPLLPQGEIHHGFMVLLNSAWRADVLHHMMSFLAYYTRTWMMGRNYEILSVFQQPDRTNNACEAANRVLALETGPYRPNIWHFIHALKRYEHCAYADVVAWKRGLPFGRPRTSVTLRNDAYIKNFTADLLNYQISIRRFLRMTSTRVLGIYNNL